MTNHEEPRSESGHATPEGYTAEQPTVAELGQPGTPGAGMTTDVPRGADAVAVAHGDDHGHAEPRVGPVDWGAWAYALLGAAAGLAVIALFWVAIS